MLLITIATLITTRLVSIDAAAFLTQFTKRMRAILENSGKILIPQKEEMDVLKIYTELDHHRNNGRFEYSVNISENIDPLKTAITPMLPQSFIENPYGRD